MLLAISALVDFLMWVVWPIAGIIQKPPPDASSTFRVVRFLALIALTSIILSGLTWIILDVNYAGEIFAVSSILFALLALVCDLIWLQQIQPKR